MLRIKDYPREVRIKDSIWDIAFVRKIPGEPDSILGLCDPSLNKIYVRLGQSKEQTFKTVCHELVHAAEHEYVFELPHAAVWKLEDFFFDLIKDNL